MNQRSTFPIAFAVIKRQSCRHLLISPGLQKQMADRTVFGAQIRALTGVELSDISEFGKTARNHLVERDGAQFIQMPLKFCVEQRSGP